MPEKEERKKYCPSCGIKVPVYSVITAEGESERCQFCNSELSEDAGPGPVNFGRIYVVEDTHLLREMMSELMVVEGLAGEVLACENGGDFLTQFTQDLINHVRPGLIMLDVVMPILNGINAAVALRSIETAFAADKVPLLFFTVKPCDEAFRKVMQYCSPSMYINKGSDAGPETIRERVKRVVSRLWVETNQGKG